MYDILSREPGNNGAPEVIHDIGSDALLDELWPGLGDSGPDGGDLVYIAEAMRAEGRGFTFGSADDWLYRHAGYSRFQITGKMVIDGAARLGYCDAPGYF